MRKITSMDVETDIRLIKYPIREGIENGLLKIIRSRNSSECDKEMLHNALWLLTNLLCCDEFPCEDFLK